MTTPPKKNRPIKKIAKKSKPVAKATKKNNKEDSKAVKRAKMEGLMQAIFKQKRKNGLY